MSAPPPFLFVVGCGRSGTTVLRTILDAHPELAVTHESKFIAPLGIRRHRYERPDGFDVDRFIHDLLADPGVRANLGLEDDWVREALAAPVTDYPDAVRRVFAAYAARQHKRRYGDKMPGSVLRIPLLAELFPEARFVHIIRDGRDVALSSMAIEGLDPDPVSWALNWKARVTAGRKAGRRARSRPLSRGALRGPDRRAGRRHLRRVCVPRSRLRPGDAALLRAVRPGTGQGPVQSAARPAGASRSRRALARGAPTCRSPSWRCSRRPPATCSPSSGTPGRCLGRHSARPGPGRPGCGPVAGPAGAGPPSGSAATLAGDSLTVVGTP